MSSTTTFTIGDAARRCGISPESIRHYERIGLLPEPLRGDNGYRHYSQEGLDRLATIRAWRDIGMSLDEIRSLNATASGKPAQCDAVQQRLLRHADDVSERIKSLQSLEARLRSLAVKCESGEEACPVVRQMEQALPEQK